jgi:hypothetical protein
VNVTDRYTGAAAQPSADDRIRVIVRVLDNDRGKRIAANVSITDATDASFKLEGRSRDESADLNNILSFPLSRGHAYKLHVEASGQSTEQDLTTTSGREEEQAVVVRLSGSK